MEPLIPKVDRELIAMELTEKKFLRNTNYGKRQIFIVTHHDSPNVMREIGRLRELSFRDAGGGTGKELDIDIYDTARNPFQQLIVWDPDDEEIIGGYRFIHCQDLPRSKTGSFLSPTAHLFHFTQKFIDEFVPVTIELGRSFVQPAYQASFNVRKGMFSLDNLWDGLGAIVIEYPNVKYFFGKMTMYTHYHLQARDTLLYFLHTYFPDPDHLVYPHEPVEIQCPDCEFEKLFNGSTYDENYRILNQTVREFKENIPPLVNAYMNLSPTMRFFGTAINKSFGNVEETGILITINDVYEKKKTRHLATYIKKINLRNFKLRIRRKTDGH
jgi:hypothetical protein